MQKQIDLSKLYANFYAETGLTENSVTIHATDNGCCGPDGRETDCMFFDCGDCLEHAFKLCTKGFWFEAKRNA